MVVGEKVGSPVSSHVAEMAEGHVVTKLVDDEIRKSRRDEPFCHTRYFAHDFPERRPSFFDPVHTARSHSGRQSV
jgi:hypothetical protein